MLFPTCKNGRQGCFLSEQAPRSPRPLGWRGPAARARSLAEPEQALVGDPGVQRGRGARGGYARASMWNGSPRNPHGRNQDAVFRAWCPRPICAMKPELRRASGARHLVPGACDRPYPGGRSPESWLVMPLSTASPPEACTTSSAPLAPRDPGGSALLEGTCVGLQPMACSLVVLGVTRVSSLL